MARYCNRSRDPSTALPSASRTTTPLRMTGCWLMGLVASSAHVPSSIHLMPFQRFTARLTRWVQLSELTKHLEFEMNGVARFGFVPGQWLSFKTNEPDGEEIIRAYSLASPPETDSKFALCLNRVQDGFMSNFLCDMKEGEEIQCQGPFGDFILRPPMRDAIFIATGTGIAPFRSMLHWLLSNESRHQGKQLYLVFGNRTEKDSYYHDEFLGLAKDHTTLHYL